MNSFLFNVALILLCSIRFGDIAHSLNPVSMLSQGVCYWNIVEMLSLDLCLVVEKCIRELYVVI